MGKFVLMVVGVALVYWLVRSKLRRPDRVDPPRDRSAEAMVRCAECGVHLPRSESLVVRGQYYCCAEHQRSHDPDR